MLEAIAFTAERLLLSPDWRDAIDEVLARLGAAAEVSRAYLIRNVVDADGRDCASQLAEWCAPGVASQFGDPSLERSPWDASGLGRWPTAMRAGESVVGAVDELPAAERPALRARSIVSLVCVPVRADDGWWGLIGFDDCGRARDWSGTEHDALRAAATVLGAAVTRRHSDMRAAAADARYRAFVEHIPAVTYTDIIEGDAAHLEFLSPQIETILGYPRARFIDDPAFWFSIVHPDDLPRVLAAADAPTRFDEEYRMTAADGRTVWVHDTSTPVADALGRTQYWLGFLTDVTERRAAEDALRVAEDRFRQLVERTPVIVYQELPSTGEYLTEENFTYLSPQVEAILGYPMERWMTGGFWLDILHPDDRDAVLAESSRTATSGDAYKQDYRMIAADGRVIWFHDESVLIRDAQGKPLFWQGVIAEITERKEAEEALARAEERYRVLVEHIPAVVYAEPVADPSEPFYVSPQLEAMAGYTPDDWRATPDFWQEHLHPDDRERVLAIDERTDATGEPFVTEYRFRCADGSYRWVHDEAVQVRGDAGQPLFWQGVMLDVTRRMRAEERLRAAESRFRALVEHIPAVVYMETPDGDPDRFYLSPQVRTVFGWSEDEWRWTPGFWIDHVHPDDRERVMAVDGHSNRTKEPYSIDYRFRSKDHDWLWIHDEAIFLSTPDGEFWQGFLLDITERKRAEEQLRETERKFRTIVEQNRATFYTQEADPDDPSSSNTVYVAPGNTDLLGYSPDEMTADPELWKKILHPEDRERVMATYARGSAGDPGTRFSVEYRVIRKDGDIIWVQDEATLVQPDGREPYWQGFLLDISERKHGEERLELALAVEREATNRLRALDDMKNTFLQAVSHDLRTPLSAILGLAVTLERPDIRLEPDDARDLARRIAHNARRLERLVRNLLDMDRLARGIVTPKLEPTDLAALVSRVMDESQVIEPERLIVDLAPIEIPADAAKVERIVENLLANTARHTPPAVRVWVTVRAAAGGVELIVEDEGPGVPEDQRDRIFEPFQQASESAEHSPGVGVGLTLVRRFAELHGGRAWVQERDGGGASFHVFLPGVPDEARGGDAGTPADDRISRLRS
jgi:PAS domain S-box-containing protein